MSDLRFWENWVGYTEFTSIPVVRGHISKIEMTLNVLGRGWKRVNIISRILGEFHWVCFQAGFCVLWRPSLISKLPVLKHTICISQPPTNLVSWFMCLFLHFQGQGTDFRYYLYCPASHIAFKRVSSFPNPEVVGSNPGWDVFLDYVRRQFFKCNSS